MRDRADFIENLKMAQVHLMILVEDIKYPLPKERQEWLYNAYLLINYLSKMEMQDDLRAALEARERLEAENDTD